MSNEVVHIVQKTEELTQIIREFFGTPDLKELPVEFYGIQVVLRRKNEHIGEIIYPSVNSRFPNAAKVDLPEGFVRRAHIYASVILTGRHK